MNFCRKCGKEMGEGVTSCDCSAVDVSSAQSETTPPPKKAIRTASRVLGNIFMIVGLLGALFFGVSFGFSLIRGTASILEIIHTLFVFIGMVAVLAAGIVGTRKPKAHIASAAAFIFVVLLVLPVFITSSPAESSRHIQRTAEEYIVYKIENAGFVAPTSAVVLRAGYSSAEFGDEFARAFGSTGIFYFTVQAGTRAGGQSTGDSVILHGGARDKEIMSNNDPGNNYNSMEHLLDVAALNAALGKHWESLGIN